MARGHWGGDGSGILLLGAFVASTVGSFAPWWVSRMSPAPSPAAVPGDAPTPTDPPAQTSWQVHINIGLWHSSSTDDLHANDEAFDLQHACTNGRVNVDGDDGYFFDAEDCSLVGPAKLFLLVSTVCLFLSCIATARNRSSSNRCLVTAACFAGFGAACGFAGIAIIVAMPLSDRVAVGGSVGFVAAIAASCTGLLAVGVLLVAKKLRKEPTCTSDARRDIGQAAAATKKKKNTKTEDKALRASADCAETPSALEAESSAVSAVAAAESTKGLDIAAVDAEV